MRVVLPPVHNNVAGSLSRLEAPEFWICTFELAIYFAWNGAEFRVGGFSDMLPDDVSGRTLPKAKLQDGEFVLEVLEEAVHC